MHKYRIIVNPYALEEWINDMAAQGWHLKKFSWVRFTFERGEPNSHSYRHDEVEWGTPYENDYLEFLQSSGIELVDRSGNLVFFRKHVNKGPFELHTDKKTKIKYVLKKIRLLAYMILLNLVVGLTGITRGFFMLATEIFTFTMSIFNLLFVLLFIVPCFCLVKLRQKLQKEIDVHVD